MRLKTRAKRQTQANKTMRAVADIEANIHSARRSHGMYDSTSQVTELGLGIKARDKHSSWMPISSLPLMLRSLLVRRSHCEILLTKILCVPSDGHARLLPAPNLHENDRPGHGEDAEEEGELVVDHVRPPVTRTAALRSSNCADAPVSVTCTGSIPRAS